MKIGLSIWMFKDGTGGLQTGAKQLAHQLQRNGHDVVVVTKAISKVPERTDYLYFNDPVSEMSVDGFRVVALWYSPAWRPVQWLLSKCVHRRLFQSLGIAMYRLQAAAPATRAFDGCDVVHHIGQATALIGFAARDAARRLRVPFIVQPTCHPHQTGDSGIDLRLFRAANHLFVHTQFEARSLRAMRVLPPATVLPLGIDVREDGDSDRFRTEFGIAGPMILYVGRKDPDKGYPLVIEAFRSLRRSRGDVKLVCMGPDGSATAIPRPEGVVDLGFAAERVKHDALAACTVVCVPSEGESFGLIFIEAGRYAKPVIARRIPVLEELLGGGEAGLLLGTPHRDRNCANLTADELCAGMEQLLADAERRHCLGNALRRVSDEYLWPNIVKRFESAYETVIRNFRSPSMDS